MTRLTKEGNKVRPPIKPSTSTIQPVGLRKETCLDTSCNNPGTEALEGIAIMGLQTTTRKNKQRRKPPYPNSILDRTALIESLEESGIPIKNVHLDTFYQAIHRQQYPPLAKFVENYYKLERNEILETTDPISGKTKAPGRKHRNRQQLPKDFLEFLLKTPDFVTLTTRVQQAKTSSDGSTTKVIVELYDGQVVESVLMRYDLKGAGRASLCVSSQVGCAMGCTFCATGTMGLFGNLTSAEILEQMVHANHLLAAEYEQRKDTSKKMNAVRNVVFMGMGEPLDNYNNVVTACRAMMENKRWNLAHGRITVSTVGLISQIRKLTKELPEVSLALSLHAPNQQARTAIVPTATRYPIESLIQALDDHMMAYLVPRNGESFTEEERVKESTRRRAMIEYVMLQGETSSLECAHQLGRLCENRQLVVNLIPYNATDVKDKLQCPSVEHMQKFRDIVASYGTFCTIRRTMGADIASACGQLVQKTKEGDNSESVPLDIEDVVGGNSKSSSSSKTAPSGPPKSTPKDPVVEEVVDESPSDDVPTKPSWLEFIPNDKLDLWMNGLLIATAVSSSCFMISTVIYLRRRR